MNRPMTPRWIREPPTAPAGEAPVGGAVKTGSAGSAAVTRCAGDQVTGDPYSPPCIQFSGDNGGATHHGVTAKEIHVAVRVLNEKGFQQTLAALAGASLSDTPDDIKRTMTALAEYFNKSYQFYGRKIVLDFYNGQGSNTTELLGGGRDKAQVDATTVQVDGELRRPLRQLGAVRGRTGA